MTTTGPWQDDAMWSPDLQPNEALDSEIVLSEHHFTVIVAVRKDGSFHWRTEEQSFDPEFPVYLQHDIGDYSAGEWIRVNDVEELGKADAVVSAQLYELLQNHQRKISKKS